MPHEVDLGLTMMRWWTSGKAGPGAAWPRCVLRRSCARGQSTRQHCAPGPFANTRLPLVCRDVPCLRCCRRRCDSCHRTRRARVEHASSTRRARVEHASAQPSPRAMPRAMLRNVLCYATWPPCALRRSCKVRGCVRLAAAHLHARPRGLRAVDGATQAQRVLRRLGHRVTMRQLL